MVAKRSYDDFNAIRWAAGTVGWTGLVIRCFALGAFRSTQQLRRRHRKAATWCRGRNEVSVKPAPHAESVKLGNF